jgi:hypothetical protein
MDTLLEALLLPPPLARQAWDRWRVSVDIHALPYVCQQLFPTLGPALFEWLEGDPAEGLIQGIVRMLWTQNQLRLRRAVQVDALLKQAGVRPVAAGPLAWSLKTPAPAIRPIPHLTFLVARQEVHAAAEALTMAGWTLHGDLPSKEASDWYGHVCFRQDIHQVNLHWRLIATRPQDALDFERTCLSRLCPINWSGQALTTTSPEVSLLHKLCDPRDGDWLPWQADLALAGAGGVHWERFRKLVLRFVPQAIERLEEFREYSSFAMPSFPAANPAPLRRKVEFFWDEYRTRNYHRKEPVSWLGFAEFLAERWNLRHSWQVPLVGARLVLQHRKSLLR